ncbi:MAG TPA: hypothetical protein VF062_07745 [Candidatus Limnocylindrales bacterium]
MIVIRYTGKGWLAFMLFMGIGMVCLALVSLLGLRDEAFLITFAVLYVLIGTPLHWRIGTNINAKRPVHFFGSMPMEYWAVWYPVIAMVAFGGLAVAKGNTFAAWAIGIGTLAGLIAYARLAGRHFMRKHFPEESERVPVATGRRQLAAQHGWSYEEYAPQLRARWYGGYGADADRIAPMRVLAGIFEGVPFTVFDTEEKLGSRADRRESLRTVCMVHLEVALPDARLRGKIPDEERYAGTLPPVADEPPWNCDLLPRVSAINLMESGDQASLMVAESDLPGFAGALVTSDVWRETLRHRVPGWRIHGRDLVFVSIPGAGASLSNDEAMAAVAGLAAIAKVLPQEMLQRYGQPPNTGSVQWSPT